ncbi:MAG TPA: hypothetical protein EYH39_04430 [Desulfurobacteriaceae bacterium]|nr:hypothetical protein [Desulfurobacteriaceae bacterium]
MGKIIFLFLLLFFIKIAYSKSISLDLTNATFSQVLQILSKKYNYNFILDSQILSNKSYYLKVENISLNTLLNYLLKDSPYTYQIINNTIFLYKKKGKVEKLCKIAYTFQYISPEKIKFPKDFKISYLGNNKIYIQLPCTEINKTLTFLRFLDKQEKQFKISIIFFSINNLKSLEKIFNLELEKKPFSLQVDSGFTIKFSSLISLNYILTKLSYLEKLGESKIYSHQNLVLVDGEEGSFSQDFVLDYMYKDEDGNVKIRTYKLPLKLKLKVNSYKDFYKVSISFTKSSLDSLSDSSISYYTNTLKSTFFLYPNQILLIGGFEVKEESQENYKNGFSKVPVLGNLFKNAFSTSSQKKLFILIKVEEIS